MQPLLSRVSAFVRQAVQNWLDTDPGDDVSGPRTASPRRWLSPWRPRGSLPGAILTKALFGDLIKPP